MTLLLALAVVPFVLLTVCFATETLSGLRPKRVWPAHDRPRPAAVIIVPAHDEELIIGTTLLKLKEAAGSRTRILLVADNCRDATAATARKCGVTAIERVDPERRGKGFALDFARDALAADPPDVVLVVDADCFMDSASITELIDLCFATGRPCQALYIQVPAPGAPPTIQLSAFAFFVRNVIRQRGLERLAGRVHLVGTGMAFPWSTFAKASLASDNLVEDLQLGLELAEQGFAPLLAEQAVVSSFAATKTNSLDQRRRWEAGYLQTARRWGPKLLVRSLTRFDPRGLWAAISLLVPPFTLLLLLDLGLLSCAVIAQSLGAGPLPAVVLGAAVCLALAGLVLAWISGGSRFVPFSGLVQAPLYVLWKVPLYLGLARGGPPKEWVRTGRD